MREVEAKTCWPLSYLACSAHHSNAHVNANAEMIAISVMLRAHCFYSGLSRPIARLRSVLPWVLSQEAAMV